MLYRPFARAVLDGTPGPALGRYALRRGLRVLPAYWVILLAVSLTGTAATIAQGTVQQGRPDAGLFVLQLGLLQTYTPRGLPTGIVPAWSLTVEVAFYVLLPG